MSMLIYLADLYHDYLETRQHVPLGIGYIGEYLKSEFPGEVEIRLFKSVEKLLNTIDAQVPDMIGLSNYTWNDGLNKFAGEHIKALPDHDVPIVMGGPNIRIDEDGIEAFLQERTYVDRYVMYAGERPMAEIVQAYINLPAKDKTSEQMRALQLNTSYALTDGLLEGGAYVDSEKDLDYVPSPYLSGAMDEFLDNGFLPIVESNRGCPFSCTFCVWGISALSKLKQFSMERVKAELDYIVKAGREFSEFSFADANFGILKRDVEISRYIRDLYDEYKSFQSVQIYWSKSAQPHMVDIGRNLGELTHTYVAFQSLDPVVLEAIKRKNISTEKLVKLINDLRSYTHSTQTDLLVGLPNEDFDSHVRSLEGALRYGINLIQGGEIRVLPGSEMDSIASREQYQIKTKYRLCEGQYGYYRGKLIYELEEVVRQTSTMTEDEMLSLRVLRTIFYASVTLGEHRPLINYLVEKNCSIIDFFKRLVEPEPNHRAFGRALNWCVEQAREEWFDTRESAAEHLSVPENAEALFGENIFLKLNYGMLGRLICNTDEYDDFYDKIEDVLIKMVSNEDPLVLQEIATLCRARNVIFQLLKAENSENSENRSIMLSAKTQAALKQCHYPPYTPKIADDGTWTLTINPLTFKLMDEQVSGLRKAPTIVQISQLLEIFRGRSYLEPLRVEH